MSENEDARNEVASHLMAAALAFDDAVAGASAAVAPNLETAAAAFETAARFTGPIGIGVSAMLGAITEGPKGALKEFAAAYAGVKVTEVTYSLSRVALAAYFGDAVEVGVAAAAAASLAGFLAAIAVGSIAGVAIAAIANTDPTYRDDPASPLSGFEPDGMGGFDLNDPVYHLPNYTGAGTGLDSPGEHTPAGRGGSEFGGTSQLGGGAPSGDSRGENPDDSGVNGTAGEPGPSRGSRRGGTQLDGAQAPVPGDDTGLFDPNHSQGHPPGGLINDGTYSVPSPLDPVYGVPPDLQDKPVQIDTYTTSSIHGFSDNRGGGSDGAGGGYAQGGNGGLISTPVGDHAGHPNGVSGNRDNGWNGHPVLLDLSGSGLSIDPLSSSTQFLDLNGDGYEHRTAWAGKGNGVLVLDLYGDGKIHQKNQLAFTQWDPSAASDLQALKDVFDTNHDGKLDAGDADWSMFKVMVNGQMVSLASLGITSIDLTPTGSGRTFNDGSAITGTTTYTKSDGTTGQVGDAILASDSNGYLINQAQTTNADGSVTKDILGYNTDGSKAFENVVTVSANGQNKTTRYDDNGDGVFDRNQTDIIVLNADGSSTETITDLNADGSKADATATTTSADTKTITTIVDQNGDSIWDQSETFVTNADGSTSTTTKQLAANGTTINQIAVTTSADGQTKTTKTDHTGSGSFDFITTDATVVNADGSRVETVTDTGNNGTLLDKTVTTTSADSHSKTVHIDHAGSGTFDTDETTSIVINSDNSVTTTVSTYNGAGTTQISKTVTTTSADGLTKTVSRYLDGGTSPVDQVTDIVTVAADGSRTEAVSDYALGGTPLSKTVTATSGDKKSITTTIDSNGDGATDQAKTIVINADGSTTTTLSNFASNGTLINRTLTTASAGGLSTTIKTDINGEGTYDLVETDAIVANADGSRTETVTDTSANGTSIGKTITATTANGLTQTKQEDLNGDGIIDRTVTDAIVLNADGSRTQTLSTTSNTGVLLSKTVTTDSADRKTSTVTIDRNGDGHADQTRVSVLNVDGSTTQTVTDTSASGVQIDQMVTATSANGLSTTVSRNIDGAIDDTVSNVTVLNADGSKTETISDTSRNGTLLSKRIVTASGNGLSVTMLNDANGDGVLDSDIADVTVFNADGSKTETVSTYNGAGTTLISKTVTTSSGDGLTKSVAHYLDGSSTPVDTASVVVSYGTAGSVTETVSDYSGNNTLLSKTVTVSSGDKKTVTVTTDIDGNGVNDVSTTAVTNADGSVTTVTSAYSATGILVSKSTKTVSATGMSTTIATDLNGDGVVDQSKTDIIVLNADGSRSETISDLNASGGLKDKTVITTSANGLSITTQMDGTGAGTFSRTTNDVETLNADGSITEVSSDLNPNGSLHDKTTTTTSASRMTITTARDVNGDGTVDQTVLKQVNTDGSVTTYNMDGTVNQNVYGLIWGGTNGRYETDSANGLSKTVQYDANGDTRFENQTTDVTVLNADGSKVDTITDSALTVTGRVWENNGWWNAYSATTKDKEVISTSKDGLTVTKQFDLTGSGTFGKTSTDQTVLNADGSKTETIAEAQAGAQMGKYAQTTSADGLSRTKQWYFGGSSTPSETSTDVKVINATGSSTETVTNTGSNGALLSKSVSTTSANGLNVWIQRDTTGSGSFNQSEADGSYTLADGSIVTMVGHYNGSWVLKDQTVTTRSADGRITSVSRDANGDGIVDQTEAITKLVDGSSQTSIWDLLPTGAVADWMSSTTSFDGLTTNTSWDFNNDGTVDRSRSDTRVYNANGSYSETVKDYQTSTKISTGWGSSKTPVLLKTTSVTVSADGKTKMTNVTLNNDSSVDETSTTVTAIDGSTVTTATNDAAAKAVAPLPGKVLWSSAISTSNKTVASKVITSVSADGLSKIVQADYDGNGTYEHTETWQTQIDGSQIGTIQDVNSSGTVVAKGTENISADGLTTTLNEDTDNNGTTDHVDAATTHIDGTITETVTNFNTNGTLKQTIVTNVSADGQSTSVITTTPPASSGALATSTTAVNGVGMTTTESNSTDTATVNGNNNILTVTSGQETATVTGTGNIVNVNGTAAASVTGGTGTVVNFNSSGSSLTATSETINLAAGSNVTIGGTSDTIVMNQNETVTLASVSSPPWSYTGHSDTFVFQPNFGHETISGFIGSGNVGTFGFGGTSPDQIDINHAVFADWAHLLAASSQSGSDVIITADANDTITLKNTTLAQLQGDQSQFHFT
ncbi:adhesin [Mesorhizobium sp. CA3]|uniref:beta strand repeat-containing protein n=1 Tax=Mesorhizobium sp. CA3 TaxID=2876639 RepID=UPI001CCF1CC9|nr:adhesin [Mesorhizobium sp. CA3]MBZ9840490.1 adhesin [Mesorhizobium sp. CA3]